jgi:hydrophobic/amphiphilic exporter-1 (mainly G- bacteria), HAE1 family
MWSAIAIRRPVFTVMITVALLVLGGVGFSRLGTDLFPDVSVPVVAVHVGYPGGAPGDLEMLITREVEDAVMGLGGVDRVRSFSREGDSTTIIFFKLGVDAVAATADVRERVAQVRYRFPSGSREPIISRFDIAATPVAIFSAHGSGSLAATRQLAEDVIKPALEQVSGVAAVEVRGGAKREVHVDLDRARIDALSLDAPSVAARIRAANLTVPAGRFDDGSRELGVRTLGELVDVEDLRQLVVARAADGSVVRLSDVARVEDGLEEQGTRVRTNGQGAVSLSVLKQSGRNTVKVADAVKARLRELRASLPPDLSIELVMDQSRIIEENAADVEESIVFGGAMAILIVLVFMLDLRSTLISAVALPTSVIGTFFFMYALGYTLNMMTLLALSLAIGLLIDDAVVVRENIFKHLERGKSPMQAALDGTREITLSVLATTLAIVAVFVPVAFIEGMAGQFFRQFGITVSVAVLLSLFVAFTLDPMLSSRFSRVVDPHAPDPFAALKRPFAAALDALDAVYRRALSWSLGHAGMVGLFALLSLGGALWLGGKLGNEFVAAEDRGQFLVDLELPAGTSVEETDRISSAAERALLEDPRFTVVYAVIGTDGEPTRASWRVLTLPKSRRSVGLDRLKDAARAVLLRVAPSARFNLNDPPMVEGASTEAPIMIDVRGAHYEDITKVAGGIAELLRQTPGVGDVQLKFTPGKPELRVQVDRRRAADLGIEVARIAGALRTAVDGEEATRLRQGKDEIPVRVRVAKRDLKDRGDLSHLMLRPGAGAVELGDVARFSYGEGPQLIEREDRSRQIQVWATPRGRALGDIVADLLPRLQRLPRPPGVSYAFDGQIRMMNENNSAVATALALAVIFIYIVLASQFDSFVHPLTIMLTLPLALVGAILALYLTHNTLAIGTMIGLILLMGLVTKNAILLVDRAVVRVRELGQTPMEAIREAGPERLRPIVMTSAAMVLGMLPTALSRGEGSEFRAPMAIAVIGGVISSTLLSLLVVPVVYLTLERLKTRTARPSSTDR